MSDVYFPKFVPRLMIVISSFLLLASACTIATKKVPTIARISPQVTRAKVQAGKAILVCSYDDLKCKDILLEGAILRSNFEGRLEELSKNQEIIFYCR